MSKPTAGPWEADVAECAKVRDAHGALLATCNHLEIYGRRDSGTVAANARLIAAAPALLEALNGMVGLVTLLIGRSDIPSKAKEAAVDSHRWVAAHKAIKKATGE